MTTTGPSAPELAAAMAELVERDRIGWVLAEYCLALDVMDLDRIAALFTEDCVVEYGPEPAMTSRGRARLTADLARLWRWKRTAHQTSTVQIAFEGRDTARAISTVLAWHERADGTTATLYGQYHDRVVRMPDGWRIAHRRQVMAGSDAGFTVMIHPLERRPPPPGWVPPTSGSTAR